MDLTGSAGSELWRIVRHRIAGKLGVCPGFRGCLEGWRSGPADPSTTQVYDRRQFAPPKSAALMVAYGTDCVIRAMGRG